MNVLNDRLGVRGGPKGGLRCRSVLALKADLNAARGDIVWMTVSVSDGRYSQRFTDIRKEIYGKEFPASTLLTAAAFAVPEIMVEITAIAVVAS